MSLGAAKRPANSKVANQSSRPPWFQRWSIWILLVFAGLSPMLIYGAACAVRSNTNQVGDWLPAAFSETGELAWYREHFVGDQFVVISWDGCVINGDLDDEGNVPADSRIDKLASLLVSDSTVGNRPESLPYNRYFKSVFTGPKLLEYLAAPPSSIPYQVAKNRLGGSFIGPDGRQTCLITTLSDEALLNLRQVLARPMVGPLGFHHPPGVLFEAMQSCGIDVDQARLGGPPVDNVAIDEEGERTLIRLAGLSGLLGLLLSWWSLRSIRSTLIVFACGLLSATAGLASLWLTGVKNDAIVLSMPALVYVLAISGAIHLINYYRDAIATVGTAAAPGKAIRMGWKPAILCSLTTAFGLLSLCASDLAPIRKFGFYSALGVLELLVVLFLFLPAALSVWPERQPTKISPSKRRKGKEFHPPVVTSGTLELFWDRLGTTIVKHHFLVTATFLVLIIGFASGLKHYRTSIDLMKLFGPEARILKDYRWLEANIGQLVPVEIVLCFDPDSLQPIDSQTDAPKEGDLREPRRWTLLDRMQMVAVAQRKIETAFGPQGSDVIGPSMSALAFVPPLPRQDRGVGSYVHRKLMNRKLEQAYESLTNSGYLTIDKQNGRELWRISLRVAAFEDVDYGQFTESLKALLDPVVSEFQLANASKSIATNAATPEIHSPKDNDVTAVYTGVIPIVYKAQSALLSSLVSSTIWSFLTITPLLMFVARGCLAGLVAMLPNVLPVLVVFGGISWLGQPIEIGSMMAASIALGVAVDDTIHYLTWFRVSLNQHGNRHQAILSAYQHCATPTMQATLINGLGLSVFMVSTFSPTKQFGYLMLVILFAGAIAELLLLPAILAGPLGRVFKPSIARRYIEAGALIAEPSHASKSA